MAGGGMLKSYLKYVPSATVGVIGSPASNVLWDSTGKRALVAALGDVMAWNLATGECSARLEGPVLPSDSVTTATSGVGAITVLALQRESGAVAAGYERGTIRVWALATREVQCDLRGHRAAVSALSFSPDSTLLISGGNDTDVVVWDMVTKTGRFRLRGHRDAVTSVLLLPGQRQLLTASKDTLLKLWNLDSQHCTATIVGHRSEVWSMAIDPAPQTEAALHEVAATGAERPAKRVRTEAALGAADEALSQLRVITGTAGTHLRMWQLAREGAGVGSEAAEGASSTSAGSSSASAATDTGTVTDGLYSVVPLGTGELRRHCSVGKRVVQVQYSDDGRVVGCLPVGKRIEFFFRRSVGHAKRKMQRRMKRRRVKARDKAKIAAAAAAAGAVADFGGSADGEDGAVAGAASAEPDVFVPEPQDELEQLVILQCPVRVRSFDIVLKDATPSEDGEGQTLRYAVVLLLHNNTLARYRLTVEDFDEDHEALDVAAPVRTAKVEMPGHRATIRACAFSEDGSKLLSSSQESAKVWAVPSIQRIAGVGSGISATAALSKCMRTLKLTERRPAPIGWTPPEGWTPSPSAFVHASEVDKSGVEGLCCAFLPGDQHVVVGDKMGRLRLFDLGSGLELAPLAQNLGLGGVKSVAIEGEISMDMSGGGGDAEENTQMEHGGAVWSISLRPDGLGLVTGSADKTCKFWDFDLVASVEGGAADQLALVHTRTLRMSDEVLSVKYSHTKSEDKLLLAVALLDCTVKIFYADSLKFMLSLYGHKLPVLDMSISDDDALIVTASADKNVRIWGLDFGDCHKSMFAHADSVTAVRFLPRTHLFVTGGKDGLLK